MNRMCEAGTKMPWLWRHWKYLLPLTSPLWSPTTNTGNLSLTPLGVIPGHRINTITTQTNRLVLRATVLYPHKILVFVFIVRW